MAADAKPDLVALARAGDAASLRVLRARWSAQVSGSRTFELAEQGIIEDPLVTGPRWRHEVFAATTPFTAHQLRWPGPQTRLAIASILRCPLLAEHFAQLAVAHMTAIEARLVTDETLSRSGLRKLRQQLAQLAAPGRSCWENWVWQTPTDEHDQFDQIVQRWQREPVQLAEAAWFAPGWQQRRFGLAPARIFFSELDPQLRRYLGVDLKLAELGGVTKLFVAQLAAPVDDANRWAGQANLPLRFEPGPLFTGDSALAPAADHQAPTQDTPRQETPPPHPLDEIFKTPGLAEQARRLLGDLPDAT